MNKHKIIHYFNKAACSYDSQAHIQKASANHLISMILEHFHPAKSILSPKILDVGTGTGYVSEALKVIYPGAHFTLNDIAPHMLHLAHQKLDFPSSLTLHEGDAETLLFANAPFDLIASNFVFQWFENLEKGIQNLMNQTHCLAFSTLLEGTFQEWNALHESLGLPCRVRPYPSLKHLKNYLCHVSKGAVLTDHKNFTVSFDSLKGFIVYLKALGANTPHSAFSSSSLKHLLSTFTGSFKASYKVFYAVMLDCT